MRRQCLRVTQHSEARPLACTGASPNLRVIPEVNPWLRFLAQALWASAEIDFIFQSEMNIVPLEVKSAENLQAKSLKSFCQKYQPKYAIRTSMSDYRHEGWLMNVPLYAINGLSNILKETRKFSSYDKYQQIWRCPVMSVFLRK
ncbi:hypothetical protein DP73_20065 [Desulfosporosinus sp. HMP52]|nr:hypothetical protein DP73_20065 [Desulfosporosinus sp. HMP52]